jgi:hypothetical protein
MGLTQLLDAESSKRLTPPQAKAELSADAGVYAAWLRDPSALADCGVASSVPLPLYVGQAQASAGLRKRVLVHVEWPWMALQELLATRGRVLAPWSLRRRRLWKEPTGVTWNTLSPLARASACQTLRWQHKHVYWTWIECPPAQVDSLERYVIEVLNPLLNIVHSPDGRPPQLRHRDGYERARARWLWSIAWAGVLVGAIHRSQNQERIARRWRLHDCARSAWAVDGLGYPVSPAELAVTERTLSLPEPEQRVIRQELRLAARNADSSVRLAVGLTTDSEELRTWWAAHAPAEIFGVSLRDAFAATLELADDSSAPGPEALPGSEARVAALATLEQLLSNLRH